MRTDLLRTLATNFGSNSALAAKTIRGMYLLDPIGFPPAVAELLRSGPDLPGTSFLVAMLVSEKDWLRTVCNPEKYTLEQALDLVQRARNMDPLTEVKLARMLVPLTFSDKRADEQESRFVMRVVEVLEGSPDPSAAVPALQQLVKCPNAEIRGKAAAVIAQVHQNPRPDQGSAETDPRVASNAVEFLWGQGSPAARESFLNAAANPHHRIAATGIVGLYLMGDSSSIPMIFRLGRSECAKTRAAGAWAMGYVEDPRFLPRLVRLQEDSDTITRNGAFRSTERIRQRVNQIRIAGTVRVQIREAKCLGESHTVHLAIVKEGRPMNDLDPRQLVVWNGLDLVEEFSFSRQDGTPPYYEIAFESPPSPTHLVKVQVYTAAGAGGDTGFETASG